MRVRRAELGRNSAAGMHCRLPHQEPALTCDYVARLKGFEPLAF